MPEIGLISMRSAWGRRGTTMAIALAGAALASALEFPLPVLFGPMLACLAAAVAGIPLMNFGKAGESGRTILGVAVGASITPALMTQLLEMGLSLAIVPIYVMLVGLIGVPFFRFFAGFDRVTAYYAAMPGGAADMVTFGKAGADVRALGLVHATRVALVVTIAPVLLTVVYSSPLNQPLGAPASALPTDQMILMIVAAATGWYAAARVRLFGAAMLGPLLVTLILSLTGVIQVRPPSEAIALAQFLIGVNIGVHYVGVTWGELRRVVSAGAVFVLILAVLSGVAAEFVVALGLAPPVEAFLAFAAGGQSEMTVLAIVSGAELGYVVLHHLARIVLVIVGAPLVTRLLVRAMSELSDAKRASQVGIREAARHFYEFPMPKTGNQPTKPLKTGGTRDSSRPIQQPWYALAPSLFWSRQCQTALQFWGWGISARWNPSP